ncbi:hypothetical protein I6A60_40585 [Frankia sp. AgB1.9]|uniref:hypothetical protein n=1 Tax=unclassified Frankia TaxID=2632575 RepID=UPI0019330E7F|nr:MULTISPECIES: hypothetical protein [unclassified Frankia]MBL7486621.1 hypothetical protein [Frankia sp. AgW1.1]MBL7554076.1 hypothetical protein [Frankia sp. AgB1.9]MBL7618311.1 hypothetical protein [Frankia sp. AgB1.8]
MTRDPAIPLGSAGAFVEKYYAEAADPSRVGDAWNGMTTSDFRKYGGARFSQFRSFWKDENPPKVEHVSKDGPSTFSARIAFHPKGGPRNDISDLALVLVCKNWRAQWSFGECPAESLRLDDSKHFDYVVLQG